MDSGWELAKRVTSGQRAGLAKAITLIESTKPEHRHEAAVLLDAVQHAAGKAYRVAVSGTPGVGKSTFIEQLGNHLISRGHRVAVLAVDPSSQRTGGSILGDKTRMSRLSNNPNSFVRPSPSRGVLGGVAESSRDVVTLCEAAGYDVVLVETVGVGQSETAVAALTDVFLLLVSPGGGDDLQGIKRGVMELADVIAVNKADGPSVDLAEQTAHHYRSALHLVRPKWPGIEPCVMTCSAIENARIAEVWKAILSVWTELESGGRLRELRSRQNVDALWQGVNTLLVSRIHNDPQLTVRSEELLDAVARGEAASSSAAEAIVAELLDRHQ